MQNRWIILVVLFTARMAMGFQFQAIPALSPLMLTAYGVDLTALGLLIGIYLWPGIVIAIPGGAIGARFGDKQVVTLGLVLMALGGLFMALFPAWEAQLAGRLLAGIGGILLNVLMSKLVADYFTGREIATAMGIFVNSWPVGIALALVVLPPVALAGGLPAALWVTFALVVAALALFFLMIRPVDKASGGPKPHQPLRGLAFWAVTLSAMVWGLYNAALAMVFAFGPAMLSEAGWPIERAALSTSIVLWIAALSIPLGGVIADRTGRRDTVITLSSLGFAGALVMAANGATGLGLFAFMGFAGGLAAGPIMSLPTLALKPGNRAFGMGVFFCIYYLVMALVPVGAGALSDLFETSRAAFYLGAVFLLMTLVALVAFRVVQARLAADDAAVVNAV